jgi:quinol monooxygenase YgiN
MAEIINAVAIVKVKPESKALAEELVKELAKRSRAEPGVIRYDIFRVNEKEGTYVFLEQYKSQEDFDIHRKSAHVQELLAATVEYLVEPPITVTLEKEPI